MKISSLLPPLFNYILNEPYKFRFNDCKMHVESYREIELFVKPGNSIDKVKLYENPL